MIVVAIIGLLSSVAIPAFVKYIRRAKTVEAGMNIRRLFDSTLAYHQSAHADAKGGVLYPQFPDCPLHYTPYPTCCSEKGQKCDPKTHASEWNDPAQRGAWETVNFAISDPNYFSYFMAPALLAPNTSFWSCGPVSPPWGSLVGDQWFVMGGADLNCNNRFSFYSRSITVMSNFSLKGGSGLYIVSDIE